MSALAWFAPSELHSLSASLRCCLLFVNSPTDMAITNSPASLQLGGPCPASSTNALAISSSSIPSPSRLCPAVVESSRTAIPLDMAKMSSASRAPSCAPSSSPALPLSTADSASWARSFSPWAW